MKDMFDKLDALIDSHQACKNRFLVDAGQTKWNSQQLAVFGPEYYHWISAFPRALAGLIHNVKDEESRFFLTQILFSELGSGKPEKMHSKLFERLLNALGISDDQIHAGPRSAETLALSTGLDRLYADADILRAIGGQYALERQALPMIENLYRGFKRYEHLTQSDFEYFEVHLVDEPEHAECMRKCVQRCLTSPQDVGRAEAGAERCLDLLAQFWSRQLAFVQAA